MTSWSDRYWNSPDGLKLHYRDHAGPHERPPILCIPGLTRNCRDFEPVAERYAGQWRVIAVDLRGRGLSDPDPDPTRYTPTTYVADLLKLLDQLGIADAVFLGTSLGGIITMLMAHSDPDRIAGALLNDIGPELAPRGLDRIGAYVGQTPAYASWHDVALDLQERNRDVFPDYALDRWEMLARQRASKRGGTIGFDYDPAVSQLFHASAEAPPMRIWPLYEALAGRPVTILRGALSDLLDEPVARRMAECIPDVDLVTVPGVGHTPALDEPESVAAIDRLLERVLARAELD